MKAKIVLLCLSSLFSSSLICMEPQTALRREMVSLRNTLETLHDTLQKSTKGPEQIANLEPSYLESLPNEVIVNIIQKRIPDHFDTAKEMYGTIRSVLALVTSSKKLNEVYIDAKKLLSEAIQKSKDTFSKPKYLQPKYAEPKYIELERLSPEEQEQYKIINKALLKAFRNNNLGALKLLLENGANINTEYRNSHIFTHPFTLLIWALAQKDESKVQLLLSLVNQQNAEKVLNYRIEFRGDSPLSVAIDYENLNNIELLSKTAYKYNVPVLYANKVTLFKQIPHKLLDDISKIAEKYEIKFILPRFVNK